MPPPPPDPTEASWGEYRRLILAELERLSDHTSRIDEKVEKFRREDIAQMKTDIELLRFKASLWGGTMGALVGIIIALFKLGVK